MEHIRTFFYFELFKGLNCGFKNVKTFFQKNLENPEIYLTFAA